MKKIVNSLALHPSADLVRHHRLCRPPSRTTGCGVRDVSQVNHQGHPTDPSTIEAKVNEACALLTKEGPDAFPKFKGKGSPFLFDGTHFWIHSLKDIRMLMHPFKYKMEGMEGMEGNELLGLQDERGIKFSLQSLVTRLWGFFLRFRDRCSSRGRLPDPSLAANVRNIHCL
ncbi:MAG: hypothetical protein FWF31_09030 [Desulfobulbus sp.]|nr:hypothetical protein [Desulfobulbus sp.]